MTVWILIWIVAGFEGYQGNSPVATGSVVFHSQESCEKAAAHFKHGNIAFCTEDKQSTPEK